MTKFHELKEDDIISVKVRVVDHVENSDSYVRVQPISGEDYNTIYIPIDHFIEKTEAPFKWEDAKPGMAFKDDNDRKPIFYIGKQSDGKMVFDFTKINWPDKYDTFVGDNPNLTRAPEHDLTL